MRHRVGVRLAVAVGHGQLEVDRAAVVDRAPVRHLLAPRHAVGRRGARGALQPLRRRELPVRGGLDAPAVGERLRALARAPCPCPRAPPRPPRLPIKRRAASAVGGVACTDSEKDVDALLRPGCRRRSPSSPTLSAAFVTSPAPGVPEKVRVAALKASQPGSALPSESPPCRSRCRPRPGRSPRARCRRTPPRPSPSRPSLRSRTPALCWPVGLPGERRRSWPGCRRGLTRLRLPVADTDSAAV